jgi:hypothetical protein
MTQGYEGLETPYNTSEWNEFTEAARAHFNGNSTRMQAIAAVLRRQLPKARGVVGRGRLMGAADKRIAAIRISFHLAASAAAQTAAAVAVTKADMIYQGTFAPAKASRHEDDGGRYDASK